MIASVLAHHARIAAGTERSPGAEPPPGLRYRPESLEVLFWGHAMTTREGRCVQAPRSASQDGGVTSDHAGDRPDSQMADLSRRFPPRPAQDGGWPEASQRRGHVLARLFAAPFTADLDGQQSSLRIGLTKLVHWLEEQPGRTWQDRWVASGADAAGNLAWRGLAAAWLRGPLGQEERQAPGLPPRYAARNPSRRGTRTPETSELVFDSHQERTLQT